jgi:hypothetical protein
MCHGPLFLQILSLTVSLSLRANQIADSAPLLKAFDTNTTLTTLRFLCFQFEVILFNNFYLSNSMDCIERSLAGGKNLTVCTKRNVVLTQWKPSLLALVLVYASRNKFIPSELLDLVMKQYLLPLAEIAGRSSV